MKLLIPLFIGVFGLSLFLGYTYYKESSKLKNKLVENGPEITIKGTVKKGSDIDPQSSYCSSQLYLVTNDATYQLRTPDDINEVSTTLYAKFRNTEVEIAATRPSTQPDCSATRKNCDCDPFILVNDIEQLSSAVNDSPTFSGTISCLPGEGECQLAFLDGSGKYYLLKNISDEFIIKDTTLSFTGELTPFPNTGDGVEGIIDVVEVR